MKVPKKGQDIYVNSAYYLSHGADDFVGGLARVIKVTREKHGKRTVHAIQTAERPRTAYYWENGLSEQQAKLKKEFGRRRAHPDPDLHPSANY